MPGSKAQSLGRNLALHYAVIERACNIPAADPLQRYQIVAGFGCDLLGLEDINLFADHACRRQVFQEMGLDAHIFRPVKPVDTLPAEGLTLEGNQAGNYLVEDGDIVCKLKFKLVAKSVGFLNLALHQKLALHQRQLYLVWVIIFCFNSKVKRKDKMF
ncbi:Uncharacterised protein [uncultured archaeon]|nr:Uncharacterised protein [uncultured archaeon]